MAEPRTQVTTQLVHSVACDGFLGTDQNAPLRLTFHVFDDGALMAEVSSPDGGATSSSVDPQCFVYDGRATLSERHCDGGVDEGPVFNCIFKIVRFWRRQLQTQFLVCNTTLSPTKGIQGRYVVVHGDDDRPQAREVTLPVNLSLWAHAHVAKPLSSPMRPLTPGSYALKGFTITNSGTVYECVVSLELFADGSLRGSSQDLLFPQQCQLQGKWTQDQVLYTLTYKYPTSCSNYLYTMTPSLGGLRGRWVHEDPLRSQNRNEKGHVELRLEAVTRVWSPTFHALYPPVFREITKLLLLKSLRAPTRSTYDLPGALWQHVLQYCDFHHFALKTQPVQV